MKNLITARELYRILIFNYRIKSLAGKINFQLGDISVAIKRRDVIGDIMQKWVEECLKRSRIDFLANPKVQMPPDIFLDPENLRRDWLEIKAFNREKSPKFSIADFNFFIKELIKRPWHLEADYLIFGYILNKETGFLYIQDIWLKKIWEITATTSKRPLTVHIKKGVIREIRPCKWYSDKNSIKVFECLEDFLSAFIETLYENSDTHDYAPKWRKKFIQSYKKHYEKEIYIPNWKDIKEKYEKI